MVSRQPTFIYFLAFETICHPPGNKSMPLLTSPPERSPSPPDSAVDTALASEAALRDADIAALLKTGNTEAAFVQLVERYESKVFRLCMALLRDRALAQDTAQDTFLRVWRALGRYDTRLGAFSTWIYAIARNRCLSALGKPHQPTIPLSEPEVWEHAAQLAQPAVPNDRASLQWLRAQVDALPEAYRNSLTLFYFEDCSVAEVAALLGLPQGTVKTHLHRARSALQARLQHHGVADATLWF